MIDVEIQDQPKVIEVNGSLLAESYSGLTSCHLSKIYQCSLTGEEEERLGEGVLPEVAEDL